MVLVADGRIAAQGSPREVLSSEATARAFGVRIRGHEVPGVPHLLYVYEDPDHSSEPEGPAS